ncbi:MAG TPA: PHP domain-containing protein [Ruminococcaceae bacterium]|nr:PHP domain-containing protein [Oscillospiraceae bacterium]
MKGDLHCHTRISDGSMCVEDLVSYAKKIGLDVLGITDHDSMGGVERAQIAAQNTTVRIVPGMEISSFDYVHNHKVHLLCYAPRHTDALFKMCNETLRERAKNSSEILKRVAKQYPIVKEIVEQYSRESRVIYKQHVVAALMNMGYATSIFGKMWETLFSGPHALAPIKMKYPNVQEAVVKAKESGGFVVLAHPGLYHNFDLVGELRDLGLNGIEAYHPKHSQADIVRSQEMAKKFGLLVTGGSDFHGYFRATPTPLYTCGLAGEELASFLAAVQSSERMS